jgi:hypothetical protein
MEIEQTFKSITDLYNASERVTKHGNSDEWSRHRNDYNETFVGIPLAKIDSSRYQYPFEIRKTTDVLSNMGACTLKRIWTETDGEMFTERLIDGFPYLQDKIKIQGVGKIGKFVKVFVNVGENCNINAKEMIIKATTATAICDILENTGKRTEINIASIGSNSGKINNEYVSSYNVFATIKRFEDPMNTSLIATTVSPWILRYHLLRLQAAIMQPSCGYGQAIPFKNKNEESAIYIDHGVALSESASEQLISDIVKKY